MAIDYKKEPWPHSEEELMDYIKELTTTKHDYNTSAEAMGLAAVAAFNYVASELGCTGFQAGWAQMQFIRMQRNLKHGMMILDAGKMLYPQYNLLEDVEKFLEECKPDIAKAAKEELEKSKEHVHENVKEHWQKLSNWYDENVKEEL